jgi:hypothetical protein
MGLLPMNHPSRYFVNTLLTYNGFKAHREIAAQACAKRNRGIVLCTDPCRARGLSKRIEAQGGPWGCGVSAHNPTCLPATFLSFSSLEQLYFVQL